MTKLNSKPCVGILCTTIGGTYRIEAHTMKNGTDYDDGDTRTIRYISGDLKGRVIEQVFAGPSSVGGWVDID